MKTSEVLDGARWAGALLVAVLFSLPLQAQEETRVRWVFVKSKPVAAMLEPTHESDVVALMPSATRLEVVEVRGDWYRVVLPKGERQQAASLAWIPASLVERAPGPAGAAPPGTPPATATPPAAAPPAVPARTPVSASAGAPAPRPAAPTAAARPTSSFASNGRFFIAVNGAMQESSLAFEDSRSDPFYAETKSWTARYGAQGGYGFDVGGGVRLWRGLAAAIAVSRFEDAKRTAVIAGEIPHPFHFDRPRAIDGESESLKHAEQAVHVSAQWMLPSMAGLRLSVFGGPSFFSVSRDLVEDIQFSESYPYNTAAYERASVRGVSGSRTGFHAGMDLSWFVTPRIGVGAVARYARAELVLDSPAQGRGLAVDTGGIQLGAGLRVSLGGWR